MVAIWYVLGKTTYRRIKMKTETQLFLNEREVAEMTGFAVQTLRNWRFSRKAIPYLRVGKRSIRYKLMDVLAFMEQNRIDFDEEIPTKRSAIKECLKTIL